MSKSSTHAYSNIKQCPIGGVTEHLLVWEEEDSPLPEWTSGIDVEDDVGVSGCNTRKDRYQEGEIISSAMLYITYFLFRDKRVHRHTFGVFLMCWPCGIVVSYDELFGSEGKKQVTTN